MRLPLLLLLSLTAACTGDDDSKPGDTDTDGTGDTDDSGTTVPGPCDTPSSADTDGDGLTDAQECAGWDIWVDGTGYGVDTSNEDQRRTVTSDPTLADTDGDGLEDAVEKSWNADPSLPDTDGDLLPDADEVERYLSLPNSVDTDGDARGDGTEAPNPQLFDGNEISDSHTSPVLSDTDADGLSDYKEVIDGTLNPLVSNLPLIRVYVTESPNVTLNTSTNEVVASATLNRNESTSSSSHVRTTEDVYTYTESVSASAGFGPFGCSVDADFEASQSFTTGTEDTTSRESTREAQSEYQEALETTYEDGTMTVTLDVVNDSDLTVTVDTLTARARLFDRATRRYTPIASLTRASGDAFDLQPHGRVELAFENADVPADRILSVLADPAALAFEVEEIALTRHADADQPLDYDYVMEDVHNRTALVTVTRGPGDTESFSVATNVLRNPDGSAAGITLRQALDIIGLPFETTVQEDGSDLLTSLDGVTVDWDLEVPWRSHVWVTLSGDGGTDPDDILLFPQDRLTLAYVTDQDADGLFDVLEPLMGTTDDEPDQDGDVLLDGDEVLGLSGEVSSPVEWDSDEDEWSDAWEAMLGTDPRDPSGADYTLVDQTDAWDRPAFTWGDQDEYDQMDCNVVLVDQPEEGGTYEMSLWDTSSGSVRAGCQTLFFALPGEVAAPRTVRVVTDAGRDDHVDAACYTTAGEFDTRVALPDPVTYGFEPLDAPGGVVAGDTVVAEWVEVPDDCAVGVSVWLDELPNDSGYWVFPYVWIAFADQGWRYTE